jgi:hypothetical protein
MWHMNFLLYDVLCISLHSTLLAFVWPALPCSFDYGTQSAAQATHRENSMGVFDIAYSSHRSRAQDCLAVGYQVEWCLMGPSHVALERPG